MPRGQSFKHGIDLSKLPTSALTGSALLTERAGDLQALPQLKVSSLCDAIDALAVEARKRYDGTIVAVTGSVGKTSTCALLHEALRQHGSCNIPEALFNTHHGVTAQIANLGGQGFSIMEVSVGIGLPRLSRILRPHVAVITAIAPAHLKYARPLSKVAELKSSLFSGLGPAGVAIVNRGIPFFDRVTGMASNFTELVVSYGDHPDADVKLLAYDLEQKLVRGCVHGHSIEYNLGMRGRHMAINSLGVLAAIHALGLDWRKAADSFGHARLPRGRGRRYLSTIKGNRVLLIDDFHNANPASMEAALTLLAETTPPPGGRRIAVLADMLELGPDEARYHAELAEPICKAGIDRVYIAGELMAHLWHALPTNLRGKKVEAAGDLLTVLQSEVSEGDVILFKGSRRHQLIFPCESSAQIKPRNQPTAQIKPRNQPTNRQQKAFAGSANQTEIGERPLIYPRQNAEGRSSQVAERIWLLMSALTDGSGTLLTFCRSRPGRRPRTRGGADLGFSSGTGEGQRHARCRQAALGQAHDRFSASAHA